MSGNKSFTGRRRDRTTSPAVKVTDRAAGWLITVGGITTILAVLGVALFLVWVVLPLFLSAEVEPETTHARTWSVPPVHVATDEYRLLGWALFADGRIAVFRLDDGAPIAEHSLGERSPVTAWAFEHAGSQAVVGHEDGTLRIGTVDFESRIIRDEASPDALRAQLDGSATGRTPWEGGIAERLGGGQIRLQALEVSFGEPVAVATGAIERLAYTEASRGPMVVALARGRLATDVPGASESADGESIDADSMTAATTAMDELATATETTPSEGVVLAAVLGRESSNFLTGETTIEFDPPLALPFEGDDTDALFLGASATGSEVYAAWPDGRFVRLDITRPDEAFIAERGRLADGLGAMRFVQGNNTLVWAPTDGGVVGAFPIRREEFTGEALADVQLDPRATSLLVATKRFPGGSPVRAFAASERTRLVLTGAEDGEIRLLNISNASQLARARIDDGPVLALAMSPKEDGFLAATASGFAVGSLDPRYAEVSVRALVGKTWYEGYPEPIHSWQSSSGSDDFEPKHSLIPLIFGTIKATFYSMLFGAPLALLAAIFTSEFLHPRARSAIKPTIELMASLPSVVLGFLAALVIAPFVERVVPATLASFFALPLAFLIGAYLWQLLPVRTAVRLERWRFLAMTAVLPLGIGLAAWGGPRLEQWLFAGDLVGWLSWDAGQVVAGEPAAAHASAFGGWVLLLLPLAAVVVALFASRIVDPWMRSRGMQWSRRRFATADLAKFAGGLVMTVALAVAVGLTLDALGFDPRGGVLDTYVQRNALVVGFVMGFAIIPIIYTISEDALSTVPEHLRAASLGAGATRWQTAIRIVLPTAMSGLFSALMIGLGRAVGETMIVLMAAGNTPVLSWNIFEGFRTLSANIAVELPEAVQGSSHYRILFLAALVLFVMTFVVNTVAEIVRQRFRKRAYQL